MNSLIALSRERWTSLQMPIRKNRHAIAVADGKCLFLIMLEQFPTAFDTATDDRLPTAIASKMTFGIPS